MPISAPPPRQRLARLRSGSCAREGIPMPSPKSRRRKSTLQSSKTSKTREGEDFRARPRAAGLSPDSTLARLEAALNLVDHVDPALAADQTVVAVASAQRFQRVTDFHWTILMLCKAVFDR